MRAPPPPSSGEPAARVASAAPAAAPRRPGGTSQAQDTQRVTADAKGTLRDLAFKIVKEKVFLVLVIVFMLGVDGGLAYLLVQNNGKFTSKR